MSCIIRPCSTISDNLVLPLTLAQSGQWLVWFLKPWIYFFFYWILKFISKVETQVSHDYGSIILGEVISSSQWPLPFHFCSIIQEFLFHTTWNCWQRDINRILHTPREKWISWRPSLALPNNMICERLPGRVNFSSAITSVHCF